MSSGDDRSARRLGAASVNRGGSRRLVTVPASPAPSADELDHGLGFDLGYRDGLARATAEAETAAIEARVTWEADAQTRLDSALAELAAAREACVAAAAAMATACDDERDWATGVATEMAYAAVVRLLGSKHAERHLLGPLCAAIALEIGERPLHLRVSPLDLEVIAPFIKGATIKADDRLPRGSCELDTPRGRVVAGLSERLTLLRDALLESLQVMHEGGPS